MLKLLETIRLENGRFENLPFHERRMNRTRKALFGRNDALQLEPILASMLQNTRHPAVGRSGLYKCRLTYAEKIEHLDCKAYVLPGIRYLQLVRDDNIEYQYKYADRTQLEKLYRKRGECDDVLIVKNGWITDTSYANILFLDGGQWVTPASPLLEGTRRERLLKEQKITMRAICPDDLFKFTKARLINAMIRFEDRLDIAMENIVK